MSETSEKLLTDAEVMAIHQEYVARHKKAFRVAFDTLQKLWPPKADVKWFVDVAGPVCELAYDDVKGDPLGEELVMVVLSYLEKTAVRMRNGRT